MTQTTTRHEIPADACLLARVSTSDWPTAPMTLAQHMIVAQARPDLKDTLRIGTLRVYGDLPPADYDPDLQGPWIGRAWIEMTEHCDPLNPDAVVIRVRECSGDLIATEIDSMCGAGSIPAYLANAVLADLYR